MSNEQNSSIFNMKLYIEDKSFKKRLSKLREIQNNRDKFPIKMENVLKSPLMPFWRYHAFIFATNEGDFLNELKDS